MLADLSLGLSIGDRSVVGLTAILRHSNVGLTVNVYVKSVATAGISAMDLLRAKLKKSATCNERQSSAELGLANASV